MAFLVKMRQSNKCGSVRHGEITKTPATFIHSIHLNNQPGRNKESRNEMQLSTHSIILPLPTYTEPRAKRGTLGTQL